MKTILAAALVAMTVGPALAGHANPWTDDMSILNMQYHEENLAQSEDTPGEDVMLGTMVQTARGKLDPDLSGGQGQGGKR